MIDYQRVQHVGIDDWAIRKHQVYATIIVDLDSHTIIDMLPSRDESAVAHWLRKFPNLTLAVRDGAVFYRRAIWRDNPKIIQVSDRFHFQKMVMGHFHQAIMHSLPTRITISKPVITPPINLSPGQLRSASGEFWLQKKRLIKAVRSAHNQGWKMAAIARMFSLDPRTVKRYLTAKPHWQPRHTYNPLFKFAKQIRQLVAAGWTNLAIYHQVVKEGYPRAYRTFCDYKPYVLKRFAQPEPTYLSRTKIAKLIYQRTGACVWNATLASVLARHPLVKKLLSLFFDFLLLCKQTNVTALKTWLVRARSLHDRSINAACASIKRDYQAILNSIKFPTYSNGPVEGKNTKTKLIKRSMFGRSSFVVLKNKMLLLEKL
ncbi:MAG: hypothetical protein DUD34_09830 [Lactobacillus sp.]|jgi:hypothetical protein|nr:MAG: hypothetical protein DUD34_09830 [Lactobacillus sp.]